MENTEHNNEIKPEILEQPTANPKQSFFKGMGYGIGGLVIAALVIAVIATYRAPDSVSFIPAALAAVRAPAAFVGSSVVTWSEVAVDMDALDKYIEKNGVDAQLTKDDLRQRVLHRLMYAEVADMLAAEQGIEITNEKIDALLIDVETKLGGKEKFAEEIERQYSWTYDEYKQRVVRSAAVLQELQKNIDADPVKGGDREKRANELLVKIKAGGDFAQLARENSEDTSAADGGDLGMITKGMTVPAFEEAAFALKKGQVSEIVKSEFGYHIIKVNDIKVTKTKGQPDDVQIQVSHILIKNYSVRDVVEDRLAETTVVQLMHTKVPARNRLDI